MFKHIITFIIVLAVWFFSNIGIAQRVQFRNYTVNNGLPSNTVWNIIQDDQGFIWLGTKNGLTKFDGIHFKNYQISGQGLSFIHSISRVDENIYWIGTENGLFSLDMTTEQFTPVSGVSKDIVFSILVDNNKNKWVATSRNGVYFFNNNSVKNFTATNNSQGLSSNQVRRLAEDDEGRIWMGTFGEGIDIYDPRSGSFSRLKKGISPSDISGNYILTLYKDLSGNIWVGTLSDGLSVWIKNENRFKVYRQGTNSINDNIVRAVYQPNKNEVFIGTEHGLNILNISTNTFTYYSKKFYDPYSISDNSVYTIYGDRDGGIWVGTYFGGVNYFNSRASNFELFYSTGEQNSLSGNAVSCFLEDKPGYFWVGTENGGLNYFDANKKTFSRYPFRPDQQKLSHYNIHALYKDKKGRLWIGTFTGGLNIYDPADGSVKTYMHNPADPNSLSNNSVYAIYEDKKGVIWVGTVKGLNIYNEASNNFTRVKDQELENSCIYELYEDNDNNFWIATYEKGLVGFNRITGKWVTYALNGENGNSFNKMISLLDDRRGNLWLGTDGGGLCSFNIRHQRFTTFGMQDGIPSIVYGILSDDAGDLWLSTNDGIVKFSPLDKKVWSYNSYDNLQGRVFNYNAYYKAADGKMFFGGINGFNVFFPQQINTKASNSTIAITNLKLFNKDIGITDKDSPLDQLIGFTNHITLKHTQDVITFEYATLNYHNPSKIRYAYMMEGFEEDWNDVNNQRNATYTNLPAGDYVFKVKSTDSFGNWIDKHASVRITVRPPFYRTTLAYIIYLVAIAAGIYIFRNMMRERLRRKNQIKLERLETQKEHELYQQKMEFFTTMAHELRTPLSLIMAPLEKLLTTEKEDETVKQLNVMEDNTNRLQMLINQLLDFRRIESDIYNIRKEKIELISFIQSVYSRFTPIANQKNIRFALATDFDQLDIEADPEALQKILNNLIINAFKFAKTTVRLKVKKSTAEGKKLVSISVVDDGIGIPDEQLDDVFKPFFKVNSQKHKAKNVGGTGIGLSLAKALAKKHEGELTAESIQDEQTTFTFTMPYQENFLSQQHKASPKEEPVAKADVLLVEDNLNMLDYLSSSLKAEGYHTICAINGEEALQLLETSNADIIISDVMMPEMDGITLCRHVKTNIKSSHIPIILLTAKSNSDTEIQGIESGADAYIMKPFKWKQLTATIINLLDSRAKLKEKFGGQPFADANVLSTNTHDKNFIERITKIIEDRIDDYQLSVEELSKELSMSRSTLHKKLKGISGYVPNEFIRLIRLKNAAKLLISGEYNISEVGYKTGFNSPSYFSRCFIQQFKLTPSEFVDKHNSVKQDEALDMKLKETDV